MTLQVLSYEITGSEFNYVAIIKIGNTVISQFETSSRSAPNEECEDIIKSVLKPLFDAEIQKRYWLEYNF